MTREHRFALPAPESANAVQQYILNVEEHCRRWEGRGEALRDGKVWNNCGPDIDEMLAISGVGRRDAHGHSKGGPWCGVGSSSMCVLGTGTRDPRFVPFKLHAGAKQLGKNCGNTGTYIVRPQQWTRWGSYKGELDLELMKWALLIVWHRGDETMKGHGHVAVRPAYDPETDTMRFWNPNAAPPLAQRNEMNERLGLELVKGQGVWHYREKRDGDWRKRLYAIVTPYVP